MPAALRLTSFPPRLSAGQAVPATVTLAPQEAGNIVEQQMQPDMADEGTGVGKKKKVSSDLMMRCYREYKGDMLALLHNDE
ncbi:MULTISPECIES: hypothetical protein [unclassified Burkholderia]|uniref:hypothetical protein n=1 Tax=unclassified Burkholderia TaxID=2613784 RepID=UPI002AB2226F|nr:MULTISPECIES: hypothetical protein [unclassified Burkholderia]